MKRTFGSLARRAALWLILLSGFAAAGGCTSVVAPLTSSEARLEKRIAEKAKNDPFPSANMSTGVVEK